MKTHLLIGLCFFFFGILDTQAAVLRGQIRDDVTNLPVEGARVEMRLLPGASEPDVVLETDPFGFYQTDEFAQGTNPTLKVTHPAYVEETELVAVDAARTSRNIRLTPLLGVPNFDLYVQVADTTTYLELINVPVVVRQYAGPTGGAPLRTVNTTTNINGTAIIRGLTAGHYEFEVNTGASRLAGWESAPPAGAPVTRHLLNQAHTLNVLLKPVPQSLTFRVQGYDFEKNSPDPFGPPAPPELLKGMMVELTAMDPADPETKLMPAMNAASDVNGEVTFPMLPGVAYEAKVKALGYFTKTVIVQPDASGLLPAGVQVLDVQAEPHELKLQYDFEGYLPNLCREEFFGFPLADGDRLHGTDFSQFEVILQGLEGTSTEGVVRRGVSEFDTTFCITSTYFLEGYLKPGRYKVTLRGVMGCALAWEDAHGQRSVNSLRLPVFQEEYVEIHPAGPEPVALPPFAIFTTTQPITLKPKLERVLGRLWAADVAQTPGVDVKRFDIPAPAYAPVPGQVLIFHQPANLDLFGDFTPVQVTTDAEGYYEVFLKPGVYGVEAPGMNGYFGERYVYEVRSEAGGEQVNERIGGAWPDFEAWPARRDNFPHYPAGGGDSGVAVSGGDDPFLQLYLRKERYFVNLSVSTSGPTQSQAVFLGQFLDTYTAPYQRLAASGGAAVLNGPISPHAAPFVVDQEVEIGGKFRQVFALFKELAPGTYDWDLADANHAFISTPDSVVLHDYPAPGRAPTLSLLNAVETQGDKNVIPLGVAYTLAEARETEQDIQITAMQWTLVSTNPDTFEYRPAGRNLLGFFEAPGYASGVFTVPFNQKVPPGAEIYVTPTFDSTIIYKVANGSTVFFGGPSATATTGYPQAIYDVELHTLPAASLRTSLVGVKLVVSGTPVTTQAGVQTLSGLTEALAVVDDPTDNFILEDSYWHVESTMARPKVRVTALIGSAVTIRTTVTNSESGSPIEGATVRVLDALGNAGVGGPADASGLFVATNQKLRTHYVEVDLPGYRKFRQRLEVDDLVEISGALTHEVSAALTPQDGPLFTGGSQTIDRRGAFLPGVTRSGSASAFELYSARDTLTATWTATVTAQDVDFELPGFENVDGSSKGPEKVAFPDFPDEVYLVDRRVFEKTGLQGTATPLSLPDVQSPHLVHKFLRDLLRGKSTPAAPAESRTFLSKAETIAPGAGPGQFTITGKLPLWELPAGDFQPALIAISRSGAAGAILFDASSDNPARLTGIAIPKWLGNLFDLLGVAAGIGATQAELNEYVPIGNFIPVPEFTASIEEEEKNNAKTGFINYTYSVETGVEVGQETPARGLASLAPGLMGANLSSAFTITSNGEDRELRLEMLTMLTQEEFDKPSYVPGIVKKLGADISITKAGGGIKSTIIDSEDVSKPYDLQLSHEISVNADVSAQMNLTAVTGKIPYAGPVLILLDKTGLLKTTGTASAGIGFSDNYCWETLRPQDLMFQSIEDPDPRTRRQHFLGGNELGEEAGIPDCEIKRSICMRLGVGMKSKAEALGFALGAGISMELSGPECGIPAAPSLTVDFNTFGDYPVVKRVRGDVNLKLNAFVQTPVSKAEKKYKWNLLKIDAQYGTETVMQLVPMDVLLIESTPADFASNSFTGQGPHLVTSASSALRQSAAEEGGAFLSALYNSAAGKVQLRLSPRSGALAWESSVLVAEADHIGEHALLRLPDGRFIVAWAETLAGQDPLDILALQQVRYAVSDTAGSNFSTPQTALFLSGPAGSLHLSRSGSQTGLFTQMILGQSDEVVHQFFGQMFDAGTALFGSATFLGQETEGVEGMEVLGAGDGGADDFAVVFHNGTGKLRHIRWNGAVLTPAADFAEDIQGGLAGYADADGYTVLAVDSGGVLKLFQSAAGTSSTFGAPVEVIRGVQPLEARALPQNVGAEGGLVYVFTEVTPGGARIRHLLVTHLHQPMAPGLRELTRSSLGSYSRLQLARLSGTEIQVHALFENEGADTEARVFHLSISGGLDANDSDGDGLSDIQELRIVDALPGDLIRFVSEVLATDDFDEDGFDNGVEIQAETDPTDPSSFPGGSGPGGNPGVLAFGAALISAPEEAGTVMIPVMRTGGLEGAVSVVVDSAFGMATAADFTPVSGLMLNFAEGETEQFVPVMITPDAALKEPNEVFTLTLSSPTGGATLGARSTTTVRIIDAVDKAKPSVAVTAPKNNAVILEAGGPVIHVTGTAKDNQGIERVEVSLDGADFQPALLTHGTDFKTATFTLPVTLPPGMRTLLVRALDTRGNFSSTVKLTVNYRVESTLLVTVDGPPGSGDVSKGFTPSSPRFLGVPYAIAARPKPGFVFDGWSAGSFMGTGVTSDAAELPKLTFVMQPGLALTASFMANPFTAELTGSFNGLALPDTGTEPEVETVGFFSGKVTALGALSGSLTLDGARLALTAVFDNQGVARFGKARARELTLARKGKPDAALALTLDMSGATARITGTVELADGRRVLITADRAHYSNKLKVAETIAGTKGQRYNLILPAKTQTPGLAANLYPQGTGFGFATLKTDGKSAFTLVLADNTKLTAGGVLSKHDDSALFAQLYSKLGLFAAQVAFDAAEPDTDAFAAGALWFRPELGKSPSYRQGWPQGLLLDVFGSRFIIPPASPASSVFPGLGDEDAGGNAELTFRAGLLGLEVTKNLNISPASKVTSLPATDKSFKATLSKTTGEWKGFFTHSDGKKPSWQAATFQKAGAHRGAHGFFLSVPSKPADGLAESGAVKIGAK